MTEETENEKIAFEIVDKRIIGGFKDYHDRYIFLKSDLEKIISEITEALSLKDKETERLRGEIKKLQENLSNEISFRIEDIASYSRKLYEQEQKIKAMSAVVEAAKKVEEAISFEGEPNHYDSVITNCYSNLASSLRALEEMK